MSRTVIGVTGIAVGLLVGAIMACSVPQIGEIFGRDEASTLQSAKTLPSTPQLQALAAENMDTFALALHHRNMTIFYNTLSNFWQQKTTPAQLAKAFAPFLNASIDLRPLQKFTPVIDKGSGLQQNGDLLLIGHYNTTPSKVSFKQTYRYDSVEGWRLVEFFVWVK